LRANASVIENEANLATERKELGEERLRRINTRLQAIVPTNRMRDVTDASRGVVPNSVAECAHEPFAELATRNLAMAGD